MIHKINGTHNRWTLYFILLFETILLIGCGSGGDSAQLTGQFIDAPVEGLRYNTPTVSGETNANGEFHYIQGERVSFFVGDILVGKILGAATISPFDLAGTAVPSTPLEIRREANRAMRGGRLVTPLEVAANIAVFLQTLDSDGDPDNGIEIPGEIHGLATGVGIEFNQRSRDFRGDFSFRRLLADGRTAGLWGGSRPIRKTAYALDSLYKGLGRTPDIKALSIGKSEDPENGIPGSIYYYTYDANGNRTKVIYDFNRNGIPDSITTYTYDSHGNMTKVETDSNGDSMPESMIIYTYDSNGNQTRIESDIDGDGTPESIFSNTYDETGNRIREESDFNGDGIQDNILIHTFDASGTLTKSASHHNEDPIPDTVLTYTYDVFGNLTKMEREANRNGLLEFIRTYNYDANGNLTKIELDLESDGIPNSIINYTYDSEGYLTKIEEDSDGDGIPDLISTSAFDANGNLIEYQIDNGGDGTPNISSFYVYDSNGTLVESATDHDGDGTLDIITTYSITNINRWAVLLDN